MTVMFCGVFVTGYIDIALWDLAARKAGRPFYKLHGRFRRLLELERSPRAADYRHLLYSSSS
jgi:hypothetical protein